MFTKASTSKFSDVVRSLKRSIDYNIQGQGSLKDIKTVLVGVSGTETNFPSLSIYPISETIERQYSGNYADVSRKINLEVRSVKPTTEAAFGQANGLVNNIKNLFSKKTNKDYWRLRSLKNNEIIVNSIKVGDIQTGQPISLRRGLAHTANIDLDMRCQIRTDVLNHIKGGTAVSNTNVKELTKIVVEILKNNHSMIHNNLGGISYGSSKTISKYPYILVSAGKAGIQSSFAGVDVYTNNLLIEVYNDLFGGEKAIYSSMDMIHYIRDIIFANRYFLNRCYNYKINTLEFSVNRTKQSFSFVSSLGIYTESFENITGG